MQALVLLLVGPDVVVVVPVVLLEGLVSEAGTRCRRPEELGVFLEVLLEERPQVQVLEPALAATAGGFLDLVAHRQEEVARVVDAVLVDLRPVGGGDGAVVEHRGVDRHAVDDDAALLHDGDEVLHLLVGLIDHLVREAAPGAEREIRLGQVVLPSGVRSGDTGALRAPHDDALQRVPLVPAVHHLRHVY